MTTRQPDPVPSPAAAAPVRTLNRQGRPARFLLSGVSSDAHTWNLIALQLFMEEMGHHVVNLGCCVPVEELLRACHRERPDCVVISSVNGHGHLDGARMIIALRADPRLAGLRVVIGGRFGIHGGQDARRRAELLRLGFDAAFGADGGALGAFREFVALRLGSAS
jgi:methylmalonyl-CoA mutase cobalamin-binding subunit